MQDMTDAQRLGSETAKRGFKNEDEVINRFNNWRESGTAQSWLTIMGYSIDSIEEVEAHKVVNSKTDVQIQVTIKLKKLIEVQNLQVKLVSNLHGYNQVDKRWVDRYAEMWSMPEDIATLLRHFSGELPPYINEPLDERRMFLTEFSLQEQTTIVEWFQNNKILVVSDIFRGRGQFSADWMLVVQKVDDNARWILTPMNIAINFFGGGEVAITPKGSLSIGRITLQRKGGDGGRPTANMLQFKCNPAQLFLLATDEG